MAMSLGQARQGRSPQGDGLPKEMKTTMGIVRSVGPNHLAEADAREWRRNISVLPPATPKGPASGTPLSRLGGGSPRRIIEELALMGYVAQEEPRMMPS
jgi:hypothetical protein